MLVVEKATQRKRSKQLYVRTRGSVSVVPPSRLDVAERGRRGLGIQREDIRVLSSAGPPG